MTAHFEDAAADLRRQVAALQRELQVAAAERDAAIAQQTAVADVLKVIASSRSDLQPVFDAIAIGAKRLIGGHSATVFRFIGEMQHLVAFTPTQPAADESLKALFPGPLSAFPFLELLREGETVQFADTESKSGVPLRTRDLGRLRGFRSLVLTPLMSDETPIGYLSVTRREPSVFDPGEVQLLETFADQAVIAIRNAQLFNETQEALERQTATSEILRVISQSPTDARPVFERIVLTAARSLHSDFAFVLLRDGDAYIHTAGATPQGPMTDLAPDRVPIDPKANFPSRAILAKETLYLPDWSQIELPEHERNIREAFNITSALYLPLMREGECIGVIGVGASRPNNYDPKEIAQAESFRDQAMIAIENARLFRETQEALEQQQASAEVLGAISKSVADTAPVFEEILGACQRLFGGEEIGIYTIGDDQMVRAAAWRGPRAEEALRDVTPLSESVTGRAIRERRTHHIPDLGAETNLSPTLRERVRRHGGASLLYAPMLWEDRGLGSILVVRWPPRPFSLREQALLQTFADQAAIAIENARMFDEVQARTRDLTEALQQQTATADVLKAISRTAFDLDTVLETLISTATRLCDAKYGEIFRRHGDVYRFAASLKNAVPGYVAHEEAAEIRPGRGTLVGRVALERLPVQIADAWNDPEYAEKDEARMGDVRSMLGVPLMRDGEPIGAFALARAAPVPFTARQIELVATFADQAVIAMENVRLFEEVQAKTRDLEESLAQQTATAEVLKVISRSAFDVTAVLDTLMSSAATLIGAVNGNIYLRDGDAFSVKAFLDNAGEKEVLSRLRGRPLKPGRDTVGARVLLTGEVQNVGDVAVDPDYDPEIRAQMKARSLLGVPMLRDKEIIGAFILVHNSAGYFTARHIELLQTFADQAVIAIENARLFDEVQARTRDLTEALQQQTATAEVLKVISRSAFDLQAVFDTLISSAVDLIGGTNGTIYVRDGDEYRVTAHAHVSPELAQFLATAPPTAGRRSATGRAILSGRTEWIADVLADKDYALPINALNRSRSVLATPLLRNGRIEGVLVIARNEPGDFSQRQIDLVQTFADQAVIAIENTRLFDEVQARTRDLSEALQMQTATSDVLKVISRSAFDLQAVFNTLVSSAVELGGALTGTICVREGDVFRYRDTIGAEHTSALAQYLKDHPATPGRSTIAGRVLLSGKVERIPDCLADPDYVVPMGSLASNVRSLLGVPLLRKQGVEGAIILTREEPGHFSDRQIEIVQTFADQAVIAIENVRLFDEVQARTKELAASLDDLRKAQDRLIQSEKLASLGQLTAGIAHEIKNPLNFVNNFSALSRELLDELRETLGKANLQKAVADETQDLIAMVGSNLDKVVSHGKRADSIVKNMLLHSREGSGERTPVNINAMVEEALNLAYHGARAEKAGFNVTISKSLDPQAGSAEIYAQEMTRVLLNLISNGFYATTKRRQGQADGAYEPTITASTRDLGHIVEIAIRDNGTGIPDEVKAKMFNPFFTTKPAGEGTGLGLSLSHDIVVKQHGGTIEVSTEPGAFTQFTIHLPRRAPANAGAPA